MRNCYYKTYWDGIPLAFFSEERIKEAVDCGFNLLQSGHLGGYREGIGGDYGLENHRKALELCEKYGVKYTISDSRIHNLVIGSADSRTIEKTVAEICADYKDYPALYAYMVMDEPAARRFPKLAEIVSAFAKYDPDHLALINLLPDFCTPEQLGAPDYEKYLRHYLQSVKPQCLCYDHYHLRHGNPQHSVPARDIFNETEVEEYTSVIERWDRAGFYDNLEMVREYALKYNIPYMLVALVVEHGPFRYLTKPELYYEVWQTLAYGCCAISYYNYWGNPKCDELNYRNSMISSDGRKCQHYWDVQEINRAITPVGNRIAQTKSSAVFHVGEEPDDVNYFHGYGVIEAVTGGRLTIGFFEDGSFVIANKDYRHDTKVVVKTEASLAMLDVEKDEFVSCAGEMIHLKAGEGVYLQIFGEV